MRKATNHDLPVNGFILKILAMVSMLCDHLWATIIPGNPWLTYVGRLAFPIFAFQIVEGYFHTSDIRAYLRRLMIFALISEIPLNLMYGGGIIYPFHQNVLFTFLIGLLAILVIEAVRKRKNPSLTLGVSVLVTGLGFLVGMLAMTDYFGYGILTILLFYFARQLPFMRLIQFAGMFYINCVLMSGYVVPLSILGLTLEIPTQSFALLALLPIWLYNGERGPGGKVMQYATYAFYPLHMLILALIWLH